MVHVVLIMPNVSSEVELNVRKDPPMGILYIAAVLKDHGYKVTVIDAFAENLTIAETVERANAVGPDAVGISCNYSPLHNVTIDLAAAFRKVNTHAVIFTGGNHATATAEYLLNSAAGNIDAVCLGQGERSVLNFLEKVAEKKKFNEIDGIAYLDQHIYHENPRMPLVKHLDDVPFPAYDLVDMKLYDRYNIIAARGCPYQCTYCASNIIVTKVSYRSAKNIIDEVELLMTQYGDKLFWFSDDTFTANIKFSNQLMDEIEFRGIKFRWSCLTRVNNTSEDLLKRMKRNGCEYISYGVESGNVEILSKMNKHITLDEIKSTIMMTKSVGLKVYAFFLIGYPGETRKSVEDSFELIREIKPDGVSYAVVIPLPGTPMWRELDRMGLIHLNTIKWDFLFAKTGKSSETERYSAEIASTWCQMTADEIIELYEQGNNLSY